MRDKVVLVVPGRPPGANQLIRMGFWRVRDVRTRWKGATVEAARIALALGDPLNAPFAHAHLRVTWRCRTRRKRDFDNLVSGLKPLIDGLVSAGILEDDSTECLMLLGPLRVETGCARDETVLEIERTDGEVVG